jgi:hypothetical protein
MIEFIGRLVFNWLWGYGGISLIVAIGAGAAWLLLPACLVKSRGLALHVAIGAIAFNIVYSMGFSNGASTVRRQWADAEQNMLSKGSDARKEAEAEITTEPAPAAGTKCLRHDIYDRDCHKNPL